MATHPLRLYIETSVWSHYFADDAPEWRQETRSFLKRCQESPEDVQLFLSQMVLDELAASPMPKADDLARLVAEHGPEVLPAVPAVTDLARAYVAQGAIPSGHKADATHAAFATVYEMDALVSWKYRHLVGLPRKRKIAAVNLAAGYNAPLEIVTPYEVFDDVP